MTLPRELYRACADIGRSLTVAHAEKLAVALTDHDGPTHAGDVASIVPAPAFHATVQRLLVAWAEHPAVPGSELGPAIAAAAHSHELARTDPHVQLVMSGPSSGKLHPRSSDVVLLEVIAGAVRTLTLVTYNLTMYAELRAALEHAAARQVDITVLAEHPDDRPGFKGAPALTSLTGIAATVLRWPKEQRPTGPTSLHAKLAIADSTTVLITSANLSWKASSDNLETGLVVKGGDLAERLQQHIDSLRHSGVLVVET